MSYKLCLETIHYALRSKIVKILFFFGQNSPTYDILKVWKHGIFPAQNVVCLLLVLEGSAILQDAKFHKSVYFGRRRMNYFNLSEHRESTQGQCKQ